MEEPLGYALIQNPNGAWGWRMIRRDAELAPGETWYADMTDFPQEAKDWFAAHTV